MKDKKIPWWVRVSRIGMGKDQNMLFLSLACLCAIVPILFLFDTTARKIIYALCAFTCFLIYFLSWYWLYKNKMLDNE